jgi:hypothetical protein
MNPRVGFRADTPVAMQLMRRVLCANLCSQHIEGRSGGWRHKPGPTIVRMSLAARLSFFTIRGWDFEPAARIGYEWNPRFDLSLEYYGAVGPVGHPLRGHEQVHQFYPGADINLSDSVVWNVGVGVAATDTGNQLVYKTRIGILFGHKHH